MNLDVFMRWLKNNNPNQPEFIRAVHDIAQHVVPYIKEYPVYSEERILERITKLAAPFDTN